jgi:hypothetical protein
MKNMYKGTLKGCLRNVVVYIPAKNYKELIEKMDGRGFKLSEMKVGKYYSFYHETFDEKITLKPFAEIWE